MQKPRKSENRIGLRIAVLLHSLMFVGMLHADVSGLAKMIPALALDVGNICGRPIARVPSVVSLDLRSFQTRLRDARETDGDRRDPRSQTGQMAFYDRRNNAIVVKDNLDQCRKWAYVADEVDSFRRIVLVHELVHAYQYQVLASQSSIRDERVKHAMFEGHAEYVTQQYCRRHSLERLYERILAEKQQLRHALVPEGEEDVYFSYVESMRFVEELPLWRGGVA